MTLRFTVTGTPAPQGSKKGFVNPKTGRAVVVDDNKAPLKTWRTDVKEATEAARAGRPPMDGPVEVTITFRVRRPMSHYGTRGGVRYLKPTAPTYSDKKPDGDKLTRAVFDALRDGGAYRDDAQVALHTVAKEYATDPAVPGADISVAVLFDPATVGLVGDDTEQGALL